MSLETTNESLDIPIRGIGHVPAFKNKKIIVGGNRLITAPKARKWMDKAIDNIILRLKYLCQTEGDATSTEPWQQSAIALLPQDDAWKFIPKITVTVKVVRKGEEGANIKLTEI